MVVKHFSGTLGSSHLLFSFHQSSILADTLLLKVCIHCNVSLLVCSEDPRIFELADLEVILLILVLLNVRICFCITKYFSN